MDAVDPESPESSEDSESPESPESPQSPEDEVAEVVESVGPRLRERRTSRGLSLTALSERTGISVSTLSRLETGARVPGLEHLVALARAHHVSLDELVGTRFSWDPRLRYDTYEESGRTVMPIAPAAGGLWVEHAIIRPPRTGIAEPAVHVHGSDEAGHSHGEEGHSRGEAGAGHSAEGRGQGEAGAGHSAEGRGQGEAGAGHSAEGRGQGEAGTGPGLAGEGFAASAGGPGAGGSGAGGSSAGGRGAGGHRVGGAGQGLGGSRSAPGGARSFEPEAMRTHRGYVWLLVLEGSLRLVVGAHDLVLRPGEAGEFDTRVPHWLGPAEDRPVEVLNVHGREGQRIRVRARPKQ
ncbi:helix-turn-helix domain-containing protein [Brevibacterium jeotgali]|uniref:Cupin domain-containing protein n=1 Tax=Brevibacterium jeotgali TaxID=1262550 RepID=A0A2H1L5G7_9MICO|nr:XRE family transcriptional regulator [Brevibacterium jeotgali]TWC01369.1 cupin domain [Brevibacterium jeotgali]SMY12148.1 Cupin domain-containing protein [Brevibacterium jeotgali]